MIVIGLTGSIGAGKSFAASQFRRHGAAVFDADKEVHSMLAKNGEAVERIAEIFPDAKEHGAINRKKLGNIVFSDDKKRTKLEKIIHPLVAKRRKNFIKNARGQRKKIAVLDIPLLFEVGADKDCDIVVVVSSPYDIQKQRATRRLGIDEERFKKINSLQMSSQQKEKLADYVIKTGIGKREVSIEVAHIIKDLLQDA